MAAKLKAAGTKFVIEPQIRFKGEPGEQATMFFLDPSGNALEFKAFADDSDGVREMSDVLAVSLADIEAAAARIAGHAVETPLIESPALNERLGLPGADQARDPAAGRRLQVPWRLQPAGPALADEEQGAASWPSRPATTPRAWRWRRSCWASRR
jgi:hypothetical protein